MVLEEDMVLLKKTIEKISKGLKKSVDLSFLIKLTNEVEKQYKNEKKQALITFLKDELKQLEITMGCFSPAINFDEAHNNEDFRLYIRSMQKYAVFTHCLIIISDNRLTQEIWNTIEIFLSRAYNIYYSSFIETYFYEDKKSINK